MSQLSSSSRGFRALVATQFLSALNDNLLKLILTLYAAQTFVEGKSGIWHLILINVFFVSPYILFSSFAGWLGDRFSKTKVIVVMKAFEILIMALAFAFLLQEHVPLLLSVLFLLGTQSALFSPAKYGILPEILDPTELSRGNGLLEFGTFTGIIAGTASGGLVVSLFGVSSPVTGAILVVLAVLGLVTSLYIPATAAADPNSKVKLNPFFVIGTLKEARSHRGLFLTILAIAYFWAIGSLYQLNMVIFGKTQLVASDLKVSLLLAVLGVGIGAGSVLAGKVSEGKVELGLVPLGAIGLSISSIMLYLTAGSYIWAFFLLLMMGFCSGFYVVPLNAYLQENSPKANRGNYIAASNFVSFCGMLLSAFVLLGLIDFLGLSAGGVFLVFGISAVAVAIYICSVLPEVLLRCINWLLVHLVYRIDRHGVENVPKSGGALLVCNHVSFVDASLLLASLPRAVRFLMFKPIYEARIIHPFAKTMGAIPVQGGGDKSEIENSLAGATQAIADGELVGIFAEGAITRTGHLLKFKRGMERIMKPVDAPIIPVHLDQVWGSIFSFKHGRFFWKPPKAIPYRVAITFGKPLPPTATSAEVRQAVQELSVEAFSRRTRAQSSLITAVLRTAKQLGFRKCVKDLNAKWTSWSSMLARALGLRKTLTVALSGSGPSSYVVVALPSSINALLANLGLMFARKIPVNIDYSLEAAEFRRRVQLCRASKIISSKSIVIPKVPGVEVLDVQELLSQTGLFGKLRDLLAVIILPRRVLESVYSLPAVDLETTATVVFTRGITAEARAVELSHKNISANISALQELFTFDESDRILGVLPNHHVFGLSSTLWLPLFSGMSVCYCSSPEERSNLSEIISKAKPTVVFATPSILELLMEKVSAAEFRSVESVLIGGETVSEQLRASFEAKFGAKLLEGYGASELSPLAVMNVPDGGDNSEFHVGNKIGSVGHPIPGVAVRITNPKDSSQQLAFGEVGELWVKGTNVMKGYLFNPDATSKVLKDGWFRTGDLARVESDGFVTLISRRNIDD